MKPPLVAGLFICALICALAGGPTDFLTLDVSAVGGDTLLSVSLWKRCLTGANLKEVCSADVSSSHPGCSDYDHKVKTGRAFSILTILLLAACCCVAAARVMVPAIRDAEHHQKLLLGLAASAGAFCVIQFSVVFSLFTLDYCGKSSYATQSGASLGPSPFLYVASLVLGAIACSVEKWAANDIDLVSSVDYFRRSGVASNEMTNAMAVASLTENEQHVDFSFEYLSTETPAPGNGVPSRSNLAAAIVDDDVEQNNAGNGDDDDDDDPFVVAASSFAARPLAEAAEVSVVPPLPDSSVTVDALGQSFVAQSQWTLL